VREVLDFLNDDLRVDQMMISSACAYWKAPDQAHFLGTEQTRELLGCPWWVGSCKAIRRPRDSWAAEMR
jgi:hypothetical protein